MITCYNNTKPVTICRTGPSAFDSSSATGDWTWGFFYPTSQPPGAGVLPLTTYLCISTPDSSLDQSVSEDYSLDRLRTSKVRAMGDHACYHTKIDAVVQNLNALWLDFSDLQSMRPTLSEGISVDVLDQIGSLRLPSLTEKGALCWYLPVNKVSHFRTATRYTLAPNCKGSSIFGDRSVKGRTDYCGYNMDISSKLVSTNVPNSLTYYVCISGASYRSWKTTMYGDSDYRWDYFSTAFLVHSYNDYQGKNVVSCYTSASTHFKTSYYKSSGKMYGDPTTRDRYVDCRYGDHNDIAWENLLLAQFRARLYPGTTFLFTGFRQVTRTLQPLGVPQPTYAGVRSLLHARYASIWDKVPLPSDDDLGSAAQLAAEQVKVLDVNSIAYLRDLPELVATLKTLITVIKGVAEPGWALSKALDPKTWASLHLASEYGLRLTLLDTQEIILSVQRKVKQLKAELSSLYQSVNSRQFDQIVLNSDMTFERTICYKLYYTPLDNKFLKVIKGLIDWDLYPTLQNMWDLVPFSFVVDWFVDVEGLMNALDTVNYYRYLNIKSCLWSSKDVCVIPDFDDSKSGCKVSGLRISRFNRDTSLTPHYPPLDLEPGSGVHNHLLEAGAIIVQQL